LILRKISKIDVTRCQLLRLKCTKFDFRLGSATDSLGGSTPPDLAVFKGLTTKGREMEGEGRVGPHSPSWKVWIRQCLLCVPVLFAVSFSALRTIWEAI